MAYSKVRLLTDLEKVKADLREIFAATEGVALPTTRGAVKKSILLIDVALSEERKRIGEKKDDTK
jgi:hypothetical protein